MNWFIVRESLSNLALSTRNPQFSSLFPDINECAESPCKNNATCIDRVANFECICNDGYIGLTCDLGKTQSQNNQMGTESILNSDLPSGPNLNFLEIVRMSFAFT